MAGHGKPTAVDWSLLWAGVTLGIVMLGYGPIGPLICLVALPGGAGLVVTGVRLAINHHGLYDRYAKRIRLPDRVAKVLLAGDQRKRLWQRYADGIGLVVIGLGWMGMGLLGAFPSG